MKTFRFILSLPFAILGVCLLFGSMACLFVGRYISGNNSFYALTYKGKRL